MNPPDICDSIWLVELTCEGKGTVDGGAEASELELVILSITVWNNVSVRSSENNDDPGEDGIRRSVDVAVTREVSDKDIVESSVDGSLVNVGRGRVPDDHIVNVFFEDGGTKKVSEANIVDGCVEELRIPGI